MTFQNPFDDKKGFQTNLCTGYSCQCGYEVFIRNVSGLAPPRELLSHRVGQHELHERPGKLPRFSSFVDCKVERRSIPVSDCSSLGLLSSIRQKDFLELEKVEIFSLEYILDFLN